MKANRSSTTRQSKPDWVLIARLISSLKPIPPSVGVNGCEAISLQADHLKQLKSANQPHYFRD